MPALIAWLAAMLETRLGSIVVSALLSLGISFVSYTVTVQPIMDVIRDMMSQAPRELLDALGFLWVDKQITMILSTYIAKQAIGGLRPKITKGGGLVPV